MLQFNALIQIYINNSYLTVTVPIWVLIRRGENICWRDFEQRFLTLSSLGHGWVNSVFGFEVGYSDQPRAASATMLPSVDRETAALLSARLMMCRCSSSPVRTSAPAQLLRPHTWLSSALMQMEASAEAGRFFFFFVGSNGRKWSNTLHKKSYKWL